MKKETIDSYKLMIAAGKVKETFNALLEDETIKGNQRNEIILLASSFKEFRRKELLGIEDDDVSYNRITFSLLELLSIIEDSRNGLNDLELADEVQESIGDGEVTNQANYKKDIVKWKADKSGFYFYFNWSREINWPNIIDGNDLVLYREANKKAYRFVNYADDIKNDVGKLKSAIEDEFLMKHPFLWKANKDGFGFYHNFRRERGWNNIIDGNDLLIYRKTDNKVYRLKGFKQSKASNENKLKIAEVDLTYSK